MNYSIKCTKCGRYLKYCKCGITVTKYDESIPKKVSNNKQRYTSYSHKNKYQRSK